MFIHDHKPALAMMASSVVASITGSPVVKVAIEQPSTFDVVEKWIHLFGSVAGMLAGFASATWYLYSFIKAQKAK